jgi:methyl-accepting chemotaxis protein PixJ
MYNPWQKTMARLWSRRSLRFKLACLLIIGTAVPMGCLIYLFRWSAEQQMLRSLEEELSRDSQVLISALQELETAHQTSATHMAQFLEHEATLHGSGQLQDSETLQTLLQGNQNTANLVVITDAKGQIIGQSIQTRPSDPAAMQPLLPPAQHPAKTPDYVPVVIPRDTFLGDLPILQSAFNQGRSIAGTELLSHERLQRLGLADQATIALRPQPIQNLPLPKQPAPEDTYAIEQGKVGLMVTAVAPIKSGQQVIGTVMIGTLLNRNYQLVDNTRQQWNVPVATIFAQDLRISTNVPFSDRQTRAIGTRAAREVADKVLRQKQVFAGWTNIIGQPHLTRYSPIYNHQKQINPDQAAPIGMLFVGQPEAEVRQVLEAHQNIGILVGVGFVGLAGLLAIPLAASLTKPIRRLANLSQTVSAYIYRIFELDFPKDGPSQGKDFSMALVAGISGTVNTPYSSGAGLFDFSQTNFAVRGQTSFNSIFANFYAFDYPLLSFTYYSNSQTINAQSFRWYLNNEK